MDFSKKKSLRQNRVYRIRKKVIGTAERPRMSVTFTGRNVYVQFIDDAAGRTLASATTRTKEKGKAMANKVGAAVVGAKAAEAAKSVGITRVVFDRRGAQYHGKVRALADAAREAGLEF